MTKIKAILAGAISLAIVLYGLWLAVKWGMMRVYVAPNEALVVINKFGSSLPPDRVVVPREDNSFKGVQEEVLGPGRYFLNPVEYDHQIVPLVQIPVGSPEQWTFKTDGSLADP